MTAQASRPDHRSARKLVPGIAVIWVVLLAAAVVLALTGFQNGMRAYLAAWLALIAVPVGALSILMCFELLGDSDREAVAIPLRQLLGGLLPLALLFVPILFDLRHLYPWAACDGHGCDANSRGGLAAHWFTPAAFTIRSLVYLAIWLVLASFFVRPSRTAPRRKLAGFGLALQFVVATLAAFDWYMSLDSKHVSSNYGVILISAECALAFTAALLLAARSGRVPHQLTSAVVITLCCAAFAQLVEFLVVWSANLPKEIIWYQERATGGAIFAVVGPLCLALGSVLLLQRVVLERARFTLAIGAVMVLVELVDLICLASPNDSFARNGLETALALCVLAGLAGLGALFLAAALGRVRRG